MNYQRYPDGYMVVVHSRAEAYPLQGWFERHVHSCMCRIGASCERAGGWRR